MHKNFRSKKGFTLLEIIISMCVISILSVSVYSSYMLIIKIIKSGEEKQQTAIIGKKTLETLKSEAEDKNLEIKKKDDNRLYMNFNGIEFDVKEKENEYIFENTSYLDNKYMEIDKSEDAKYIKTTSIEKVKAENDIAIDLDEKINNTINNNISSSRIDVVKKAGEDNIPKIVYGSDEKELLADYRDKVIIDIYINDSGADKELTLKDYQGNILFDGIKISSKLSNGNNAEKLQLQLNFSGYNMYSNEELKPIEISVFNKSDDNIYIALERSSNVDINCRTLEGEVTYYNNRSASESSIKLGTLYSIKVEIKRNTQNNDEVLFTGYSNHNLIFK